MLDIGGSELLVVAVVALLVVGPKELPALLRTIGRAIGVVKRQAQEFRTQFDDAIRDTELAELKDSVDELKAEAAAGFRDIENDIDKEMQGVRDVGDGLSSEIEASTKEEHDLGWLEEYEKKADAAGTETDMEIDAQPTSKTSDAPDQVTAHSDRTTTGADTSTAANETPEKAAGAAT